MFKWISNILFLFCLLATLSAYGQDKEQLPRVLIIGDSVYQHARSAVTELKEQAQVSFANWPRETVANSTNAVMYIDQLLGRFDQWGNPVPEEKWPSWDLIHVNVGLGDLVHRAPNMKSFRVMPIQAGGVIATKPDQYEKNLEELIKQIKAKAPGAKIIWANTTPIRSSTANLFKLGTEVEYNRIAERVMKRHDAAINDMYAYARSIMNMDKPAGHGADPFNFDKKPIHPPVVEAIRKGLGLPAPKKQDPVAAKD